VFPISHRIGVDIFTERISRKTANAWEIYESMLCDDSQIVHIPLLFLFYTTRSPAFYPMEIIERYARAIMHAEIKSDCTNKAA